MISPIFEWLSGNPAVTLLVGTSIFPDVIPKGYNGNAVVYSFITGRPENYMGSAANIDNSRVQITSWADSALQARNIYLATRAVLEQHGVVVSFNGTSYDPVSNKYSYGYDVSVWDYR